MDDERFDDEIRQKDRKPYITLSDGREYSHEYIFKKLLSSGLREPYMKEAFFRLLTEKPLQVEFSFRDVGKTVDIENFLRKKENDSRDKYQEVEFQIDGVSSTDSRFYDVLVSHGECISLK